jgi:hypothetical protein
MGVKFGLILRAKCGLKMYEKRVLRRKFIHTGERVIDDGERICIFHQILMRVVK